MKTHNQPIPLNPANAKSESRLVKTAALFTFRGLRAIVDAAKTVPAIVAEAVPRHPNEKPKTSDPDNPE